MEESTRLRISRVLYEALNQQGYSAGRIKYRSNYFSRHLKQIMSKIHNNGQTKTIVAGSFGEGISKLCSSDIDMMLSPSDIICVDERSHTNGQYSLVLQNEYTNSFPGYVRLRADRAVRDHQIPLFSQRCIHTGKHYLSSLLTMQTLSLNDPRYLINGPACTSTADNSIGAKLKIDFDSVLALPFVSLNVMEKWMGRERRHEWPPRALQRTIFTMIGYVVPVGHKFSEHKDIEWKISYTTAEKKLVRSMNDVQVKLYVVLKFVQKDRLKPICQNFTSYMVKNLVFWVLELTPRRYLTPETLVDRILTAFCHLKQFLENKFLPCYMIPERNLFDGRMDEVECALLIGEVDKIIDEGYEFLLKNNKLSLSMQLTISYPEKAVAYKQWLVEIEDIVLMFFRKKAFKNVIVNLSKGQIDLLEGLLRLVVNKKEGQAIMVLFVRLWQLLCPDIFSENPLNILQRSLEFHSLWLNRFTDALS